jgi:intein/homing endonuclease
MIKIEKLTTKTPVYDITVDNVHNFYANDILGT